MRSPSPCLTVRRTVEGYLQVDHTACILQQGGSLLVSEVVCGRAVDGKDLVPLLQCLCSLSHTSRPQNLNEDGAAAVSTSCMRREEGREEGGRREEKRGGGGREKVGGGGRRGGREGGEEGGREERVGGGEERRENGGRRRVVEGGGWKQYQA